jgi:HAD superfamily hydrolase (TIGR01509 family)
LRLLHRASTAQTRHSTSGRRADCCCAASIATWGAALIKAAIFDVDGTLVDSNVLHVEAWREAFSHYGKELSVEEVHAQIGKGGDQLMPVFLSRHEIERFGDALEQLRGELFTRDYLPAVEPFPKVRELFERLKEDGILIALASSAKEEELAKHETSLGIEGLVDATTSADDVERSKPAPDILESALARLDDVAADEAIVIGDSPYDAAAAAKAGMKTIGLLSGGFAEETLREAGVIAIYTDIADLLEHYDESPLAKRATSAAS